MNMGIVRTWKDPWGLSRSLRPWGAWAILWDPSGRSRPVGGPMLAVCATATVVVTVAAGSLVWVNGFFWMRNNRGQDPGLWTSYITSYTYFIYYHLQVILVIF